MAWYRLGKVCPFLKKPLRSSLFLHKVSASQSGIFRLRSPLKNINCEISRVSSKLSGLHSGPILEKANQSQ